MKTDIRIIAPHQLETFKQLLAVFETEFDMRNFRLPSDTHLMQVLQHRSFVTVVAQVNQHVVGGLTLYMLEQYYSEKPLAYIYDLAVLTTHQRQGIGKQLIAFVTQYCQEQGYEEVFVQADKMDAHALAFYRSTQPTEEEDVSHFYYTL